MESNSPRLFATIPPDVRQGHKDWRQRAFSGGGESRRLAARMTVMPEREVYGASTRL
jgi:hypothetical protein